MEIPKTASPETATKHPCFGFMPGTTVNKDTSATGKLFGSLGGVFLAAS
jgi:hypothetical protein